MVHDILTKEISLMLQNFPKNRKENRGIITLLVTGFIGMAYEGTSGYLHNKTQAPLKKKIVSIGKQLNLERNKIFHVEDSITMYSISNSDTLEKLINTVHNNHNRTTWNKKIFAGKLNSSNQWYLSKMELVILP